MSDKEVSIEYSLKTPVFEDSNILTKKIFEMAKTNNIISGGGLGLGLDLDISNCIGVLCGIIIIIIGFVLLWFKNDLVETDATITTKSCDNNQIDGSCRLNITYIVDSIQYSKIITTNKSNITNELTIKIYYSQSEPNLIQLVNPNYSIIGIGSIIVGIFIIFYSISERYISSKSETSGISGTY